MWFFASRNQTIEETTVLQNLVGCFERSYRYQYKDQFPCRRISLEKRRLRNDRLIRWRPLLPGTSGLSRTTISERLLSSSILRDDGQNIFISESEKAILIPNVWIACNEKVKQCFRTQYRNRVH